ncbi:hypothetical protein HED60_12095 [Planctomycetales bacterium ZRK34]|nr:hypothetical protein HED60_12095 [Planctomycetales bacterium ZRK34]
MIFLAICCVPFVLMDTTNIFVGVVVGGVGVVELIGRGRILQMDPTAGRMLAINQLVLMAAILIYCAWSIYVGLQYPSELATNPDLKSLNFDIAGLEKTLIWVLYGTVAAGSVIYQGLCALFYLNTGRRLRDYIQQTPPWIIQLQRGG